MTAQKPYRFTLYGHNVFISIAVICRRTEKYVLSISIYVLHKIHGCGMAIIREMNKCITNHLEKLVIIACVQTVFATEYALCYCNYNHCTGIPNVYPHLFLNIRSVILFSSLMYITIDNAKLYSNLSIIPYLLLKL